MAENLIEKLLKVPSFAKAYNNFDERIGGILQHGAAPKILGNQAVLNGKPVRWDGKDWVSPEDYNKRNESKVGYNLAQPIRDNLNQKQKSSNPVVNAGLRIGSGMTNQLAMPLLHDLPLIGKSPMDLSSEASGLITEGISDVTNVDPLGVELALAALPIGRFGLSKLGQLRIPGTATKALLPPRRGLNIGLRHQRSGGLESRYLPKAGLSRRSSIRAHKKTFNDVLNEGLDFVTEGVVPPSLEGLKFGPGIDKAVNTVAAGVLNLNPFPSTSVSEDKLGNEQIEASANIIRSTHQGLLIDIELAKSHLPIGKRTNTHLSTLKAEAGDYKRKLSLLLSTYADRQLVKDQRKFFDDLANAGDDPELIRAALNRNFDRTKLGSNISGSSNLAPEFKLEAHHELYAIESALQLMNVPPEIRREVLRIQLDRGIRYGDHSDNYRGLFKRAHGLAHPQGFSGDSDLVLVDKLRNMRSDSTAQEIADAMHDIALNSKDLSLKAGQSKAQIQTAWDFFEQILSPKEFQDFLDLGINFADTKNPLWQELRKFIEGSGRLNHVGDQSRALFDSMVLESESSESIA